MIFFQFYIEKQKRDHLENLSKNLEKNKGKIELFQINLKEKLNFLQINHNISMNSLSGIFLQIHKEIDEKHQEIIDKFSENLRIMNKKLQNQMNSSNEFLEEIEKILCDISRNYQNIITKMKLDSFQGVFSLYESKLSIIADKINGISSESYDFFVIEENSKQMPNFRDIDLQKLFSIYRKSSFLDNSFQKNEEFITNYKKNNSMHSESNRNTVINKENSLANSNQSIKKTSVLTDEKTQKKVKNRSSVQITMFLHGKAPEISSFPPKVFKTDRNLPKNISKLNL